MGEFRLATVIRENLDETGSGCAPSLEERIRLRRPQLVKLRTDAAIFQGVYG